MQWTYFTGKGSEPFSRAVLGSKLSAFHGMSYKLSQMQLDGRNDNISGLGLQGHKALLKGLGFSQGAITFPISSNKSSPPHINLILLNK